MMNLHAIRLVAIVLFPLILPACGVGLQGNEGRFFFHDQTPHISTRGEVLRPLAVGARLRLGVSGAGMIVSASSSDEDIIEVVDYGSDYVEVRGSGPGVGTVKVSDMNGGNDSIDIRVREIRSAEIKLMPWASIVALPDTLWAEGAVLLTGASVPVFVELRGEDGELLTGSGAAEWQVPEGSPATISAGRGDSATVRAMADATGPVEVRFGEWASVTLDVVEADAVARVGLYSQTEDVQSGPGGALTLENGRSHLMHVTAYTTDGRYVIGAGTTTIGPRAEESAPFAVTLDAASAEETDPDATDVIRALTNGRAFILKTTATGQAGLTVEWLGEEHTFEILVR
jgi:hypothetical protein